MALAKEEKQQIVRDALRDHLPWAGVDESDEPTPDTRTLAQLREEFEHRHLSGLVHSYRTKQAQAAIESFDIADI